MLAVSGLRAAEPALTHLHPAGVQSGTAVKVKLTGKFDPWPCQMWADDAGIVFTPGADAGTFDVRVAAEVRPGPHLVRAFNEEGVSAPVILVVDAAPQTLEQEPNNDFRAPQIMNSSTAVCNGRMDKSGDVDSFQVALQKGQTMTARVEAFVLAAGFDAMLRVVDSRGTTLAFNHDHITMDPFLAFTAPEDGNYVVQIMGHKYPASSDISFAGGDDCIYRLYLSTEACVRHTWPLGVSRSAKSTVAVEGWNLASPPSVEINPEMPPGFPVVFSGIPELTETKEPQTLVIPSAVSGRVETPGEEDRYLFQGNKNAALEVTIMGPDFGSLMDPMLRILDPEGRELAAADDEGGNREPRLLWTPPSDGIYTAVVTDLTRQGGPDYYYRLALVSPEPAVKGAVTVHSVKLEAGKSAELKVSVTMSGGYKSKLKLAAKQLPAGIAAAEVDVPEKGGEVTLTLTADPAAGRASGPFQLVLREADGGREHAVHYSLVTTSENNGVPQGYQKLLIERTTQLWLITVPAAPVPPPAGPK